ncbi:hypothetical protein VP424E501_P0032 [Vibrio phage 424E50-1]|nr:hypothetical protein VP424E501_P0032 [Vibrio phage 424E50-1]
MVWFIRRKLIKLSPLIKVLKKILFSITRITAKLHYSGFLTCSKG